MFYGQKALLSAQPPTFAVFKEQCACLNYTKKNKLKATGAALIPRLKPWAFGYVFVKNSIPDYQLSLISHQLK